MIRDGAAIAEIGGYKCIELAEEGKAEWEIVQASTNEMTKHIASKYPHPPVLDSKYLLIGALQMMTIVGDE